MSVDPHAATTRLMQACYRHAKKKKACVLILRQIPSLLKWFEKTETELADGYREGLRDGAPDKTFYTAYLFHGSACIDHYVFTDPVAVGEYLTEMFPEAVVGDVLGS